MIDNGEDGVRIESHSWNVRVFVGIEINLEDRTTLEKLAK